MLKKLSIRQIITIGLAGNLTLNFVLYLFHTEKDPAYQRMNVHTVGLKTCGRFPQDSDISRNNKVWQEMKFYNESIKLLNAYLDTRMNKTVVRVNVNSIEVNISQDVMFCQFWFEGTKKPFVVKADQYEYLYNPDWDTCTNCKASYLIACPIIFESELPVSVSLTENPCDDATNNLRIINNQPTDGIKKKFGVCTKQLVLDEREKGMKVIEWVHMLRILGAHKVHIQVTKVHPDLVEVLNHLQARDLIEWIYYFDPSGIVAPENPLIQYRMLQMSVINDCYSKVQSLYEYVAILDYDEVIMPVVEEDKSWEQILNRLDHLLLKKDLISFEHVFYPNQNIKPYEDIPNHNYMLQHVQRSVKNFNSTRGVKSFFRSDRVLVVHNHFGLKCLKRKDGWCEVLYVSKNISQLNHYRNEVEYSYNVTELDSTIWKFKDELIKAVEETLNEINFKP